MDRKTEEVRDRAGKRTDIISTAADFYENLFSCRAQPTTIQNNISKTETTTFKQ